MNLRDPWEHILESFYTLSKIEAKLSPYGKKWKVRVLGFDYNLYEWVENTLGNWKDVERSHDFWLFEDRRSAEKFVTLFNLKWAK